MGVDAEEVEALFARLAELGASRARSEATPVRRAMGNLRLVLENRLGAADVDADLLHDIAEAIDEAARRRFVRRQYIPLPEPETRATQLRTLLSQQKHSLTDADIAELVNVTEGKPPSPPFPHPSPKYFSTHSRPKTGCSE